MADSSFRIVDAEAVSAPPHPRHDVRLGWNMKADQENLSSGDEAALRSYPPFFPARGFLSAILFSLVIFAFFFYMIVGSFYI